MEGIPYHELGMHSFLVAHGRQRSMPETAQEAAERRAKIAALLRRTRSSGDRTYSAEDLRGVCTPAAVVPANYATELLRQHLGLYAQYSETQPLFGYTLETRSAA